MKRLTITIEAPRLSLADIHLTLARAIVVLEEADVHTLPPTRIAFGTAGVRAVLTITGEES